LAAANEVENKLNKQILELLKSAPAVSKPVNTSSDWYTGYGKAPIVSFVSDDKEEKLRKLIEKSKRSSGKEVKGLCPEIRKNSHKNVQLINAEPLTARQLIQNRIRDEKSVCKKPKCLEEAAAIERTAIYVNGLISNVAIMHGLLRGVRVLVKMFDKLLTGGRLEHDIITQFLFKHLCSLACVIRDADPWFVEMHPMFKEIAIDFSTKVENGVHFRPEFLRVVDEYANKELKQ
jgi:hypothetical protein